MESVTEPISPVQTEAPSGGQQDVSAAVFEGYIESYEKQIKGLELSLTGTAIYTLGQIEQLQQSIIEKFLERIQTIEQNRQEQQQKQEREQQEKQQKQDQEREQKKCRDMQNYITELEKTVRELQKQLQEIKDSEKSTGCLHSHELIP
jgi:TATA-binding protein-associated factor Taf7